MTTKSSIQQHFIFFGWWFSNLHTPLAIPQEKELANNLALTLHFSCHKTNNSSSFFWWWFSNLYTPLALPQNQHNRTNSPANLSFFLSNQTLPKPATTKRTQPLACHNNLAAVHHPVFCHETAIDPSLPCQPTQPSNFIHSKNLILYICHLLSNKTHKEPNLSLALCVQTLASCSQHTSLASCQERPVKNLIPCLGKPTNLSFILLDLTCIYHNKHSSFIIHQKELQWLC